MKSKENTLKKYLLRVEKLDVGQHKTISLKAFVRKASTLGKLDGVQLKKLSRLSLKSIAEEKGRLEIDSGELY